MQETRCMDKYQVDRANSQNISVSSRIANTQNNKNYKTQNETETHLTHLTSTNTDLDSN